MCANPFVVSTLSINSCLILTDGEGLGFLLETDPRSVEDDGFGRLGDLTVLLLAAFLYDDVIEICFSCSVGETDFPFLRCTVLHAVLISCPVPVGMRISVVEGLVGSGGKSSLLMIF